MSKHAMPRSIAPSNGAIRHVERAARRAGSEPFAQAAFGAAAAAVALRILRFEPIGALVQRWAPVALFAVLYQRYCESR